MTAFSPFKYVFPVIGGEDSSEHGVVIRSVYGTAFYVAEDIFVTAAHVIQQASRHGFCGLLTGPAWQVHELVNHEVFDDRDLALLKVPIGDTSLQSWKWKRSEARLLDQVQAVGFPYALDIEQAAIRLRAFRGHICGSRSWSRLPGNPRIHELSFPCPRGLSGAPLCVIPGQPTVTGIVIGNSITDMTTARDVEISDEGEERTVYERVESLHLGLAVQSQSLLPANSKLLGSTLGDLLERHNLLVR